MRYTAFAPKLAALHAVGAALAAAVFALQLAGPARAEGSDSDAAPWFRAHVFTGSGGCLAVQDGQSLEPGDTVQVFEGGKPVRAARIAYLVSSDRAEKIYKERRFDGVYRNSALRDSFGCYWGMLSEPPRWIAHYEASSNQGFSLPVAIKGMPPGALTIGGDRSPLTTQALKQVSRDVQTSVPKRFRTANVFRAGWRYTSSPGGEIAEVLFGRPFGARVPYDSLQICVLFVRGGRVLALDQFSRATGVEERVDTEAPSLDEKNWFDVQEQTIGYFSLDAGATWMRITLDVGFEGYLWTIRTLSDGLPEEWDHYLYTAHWGQLAALMRDLCGRKRISTRQFIAAQIR